MNNASHHKNTTTALIHHNKQVSPSLIDGKLVATAEVVDNNCCTIAAEDAGVGNQEPFLDTFSQILQDELEGRYQQSGLDERIALVDFY